MFCPACHRDLTERAAGDVNVDACVGGCGGLWFDAFELKKFDEPHEFLPETVTDVMRDPRVVVDHQERRMCPKCMDVPMMRHFWSTAHEVEIDECPSCGGVWLDHGELKRIRSLFESEEAAREATLEFIQHNFGDELRTVESDGGDGDGDAKPRRTARMGRLFSFLIRPAA